MATYHVTSAGAGLGDGSSLANAYSWANFVTAINAATAGGDDWYVYGSVPLTTLQTISCAAPGNAPHRIIGATATPGDWDNGYLSTGWLDTTEFGILAFTTTSGRLAITGTNLHWFGFNITGECTSNAVVNISGQGSRMHRSKITNSSTGSNAACVNLGHVTAKFIGCDFLQTGASGGNPCATWTTASNYMNCRAKSTSGPGWLSTYGFGEVNATHCAAIECGTHGFFHNTTAAGGHMSLNNVSAIGCVENGVDIVSSATGVVSIQRSEFTDNGGFGIDANTVSTVAIHLSGNRYRDNAGGNLNIGARAAAVEYGAITTDTGGQETDFSDAANDDYRHVYNSPAVEDNARGQISGASGLDPDTVPAGAGGGGARRVPIFIPMGQSK